MIKTSKSKNLIKGQRLETNNSMYVNLPIYRTYLFVPPTYMMYLPIWHTYLYDVPTLLEVYLTTRTEVSLKWIFWVTEKAIGQVFSKNCIWDSTLWRQTQSPYKEAQREDVLSYLNTCKPSSVTRLGDLLDFGQLFKSLWQQLFCPNVPHS